MHQPESWCNIEISSTDLNFSIEYSLFLWEGFSNVHNNVGAHGTYNDDSYSPFPWLQYIPVTEIC